MPEEELIIQLTEAARQQMSSSDTSYVAEAHNRLVSQNSDIDADEALKMIAYCLYDEVETMEKENRKFDESRYKILLDLLPSLPSE